LFFGKHRLDCVVVVEYIEIPFARWANILAVSYSIFCGALDAAVSDEMVFR
jgi:hypothetical protein